MSNPQPPAPRIWEQWYDIHAHDVDFEKKATLETVCRCFLDSAWNHAEALGVGFRALAERGQLWVLSRLLVSMARYPGWGERVLLQTWPRTARTVFAMRDFHLKSAAGEILGSGVSAWLVLDTHTRKPQRMERILGVIGETETARALDCDPGKLPAPGVHQPGLNIKVRYSDIDVNRHVNSTRYLAWLMDTYSLDWHETNHLETIEVNYLAETVDGETLGVECDRSLPEGHLYSLVSFKHGGEALRARLRWRAVSNR